jgi:TonB family protein
MAVVISDAGKVASVLISTPSGVPELDAGVTKAMKRWQFPKPRGGEAVAEVAHTDARLNSILVGAQGCETRHEVVMLAS